MNDTARIDVHQHLIPPEFREPPERHGMGGWARFEWSEAGALACCSCLDAATYTAINRSNADVLFPRLAAHRS